MRWRVPTGSVVDASVGRAELEAERPREAGDASAARRGALEEARVAVEEREVVRDARGPDEEIVLRDEGEAGLAARPGRARSGRDAPSRRTSPASAAIRPAAIETSVDLPAPFSPRSAWISPGKTMRLASERA